MIPLQSHHVQAHRPISYAGNRRADMSSRQNDIRNHFHPKDEKPERELLLTRQWLVDITKSIPTNNFAATITADIS